MRRESRKRERRERREEREEDRGDGRGEEGETRGEGFRHCCVGNPRQSTWSFSGLPSSRLLLRRAHAAMLRTGERETLITTEREIEREGARGEREREWERERERESGGKQDR